MVRASVSHCGPSAVIFLPGDVEGEEDWSSCSVGGLEGEYSQGLPLLVINRLRFQQLSEPWLAMSNMWPRNLDLLHLLSRRRLASVQRRRSKLWEAVPVTALLSLPAACGV